MPMTREQLMQVQNSARVYQERYDNAFQPWDLRARSPVIGENAGDYRRDLAIMAKKQLSENDDYRQIQYRKLPDTALDQLEPELLRRCREAAYRSDSVPKGEMRRIEEIGEDGLKIVKWIGQESFVKAMGVPGRRVISFNTSNGPMDASGRFMRGLR